MLLIISNMLYIQFFNFQPKASPIPSDFPSWVSWQSREVFLPATFHKPSLFNKALTLAKTAFGDSATFSDSKVDAPLLLVGLMFREVSRAMEMEPGGDDKYPAHLNNSPFGILQIQKIEKLIDAIVIPS
jgi:hypothetical protein